MGTDINRGYQLPEGEAFDDNLACALVFFPDYPEARRALEGSLEYLGTWLAWEKDGTNRAKLFADLWKDANEQTRDCLEMTTCLDDLIAAINGIKLHDTYDIDCLCQNIEINPQPPEIPDINYEDGNPPTTYGGEPVTDWDDWRRKVCANADAYVDMLIAQNDYLQQVINLGVIGISIIAAILGVMSGGGLIVAIAAGSATGIVTGLLSLASGAAFANFENEINAIRDDIIEAIVCSLDLAAVIEGGINSSAWDYFYSFVNWNQAAAAVRAGEVDGEYLDGTLSSTDCDNLCQDNTFSFTDDFSLSNGNWTSIGFGYSTCWRDNVADGFEDMLRVTYANLCTKIGVPNGTPIRITSIAATFLAEGSVIQNWTLFSRQYESYSSTFDETTEVHGSGASGTITHLSPNTAFSTNCAPAFGAKGIGNIGGEQVWRWCSVTVQGEYQPLP